MSCKYADWTRGQVEALLNILGGDEAAKDILSGKVKVVLEKVKDVLLQIIATVIIAARTVKFVVAEELSVGDHNGLKVSYWTGNFKLWFAGKVEDPTPESELVVRRLTQGMTDKEIIAELGGEDKAEITLSEFHSLLVKQGAGQEGVLLTNGYANIAYIRDSAGILRAVGARWHGDGWFLNAYPVDYPYRWRAGLQAVSRK